MSTSLILFMFCTLVLLGFSDTKDFDLGDMDMEGMDKMLGGIGSLMEGLSGDKECAYHCPAGEQTIPRVGHVPSSNGCGTFGLELDTSHLPGMTTCCDAHDRCYDMCGTKKTDCDDDFKQCLDDMCDELSDNYDDITRQEQEGCSATAELMYQATAMLGCASFIEGKKVACDCSIKDSNQHTPNKQKSKTSKIEL